MSLEGSLIQKNPKLVLGFFNSQNSRTTSYSGKLSGGLPGPPILGKIGALLTADSCASIQLVVKSGRTLGHELLMRALFHNATFIHHTDLVCVADRR